MALERDFQPAIIELIRERLPGCIILKNDANYLQGVPDLLILYGPKYAMLETKRVPKSSRRPNQEYYVEMFNDWSFAAFINQINYHDILRAMFEFFSTVHLQETNR